MRMNFQPFCLCLRPKCWDYSCAPPLSFITSSYPLLGIEPQLCTCMLDKSQLRHKAYSSFFSARLGGWCWGKVLNIQHRSRKAPEVLRDGVSLGILGIFLVDMVPTYFDCYVNNHPQPRNKKGGRTGCGCNLVAEHLSSMHMVLGSIPVQRLVGGGRVILMLL